MELNIDIIIIGIMNLFSHGAQILQLAKEQAECREEYYNYKKRCCYELLRAPTFITGLHINYYCLYNKKNVDFIS